MCSRRDDHLCTTILALCRGLRIILGKVLKVNAADMAELVDARDLKSLGLARTGSIPVVRTNILEHLSENATATPASIAGVRYQFCR
jgi:hypothetical protein